jgi:hypothetical protein
MRYAFPPYVVNFLLDNPEQTVYKNARCPIRIEFDAANSPQKQPTGVSAARAAGRALTKRCGHDFAIARRYDRIALAAESDSVRALSGR